MQRIKSTLVPRQRPDRGNKWYPRGTYPEIDEDGNVAQRRGWRGGGFATRAECQEECDRLNKVLTDAAERTRLGIQKFAVAAAIYGKLNATKVQLHKHLLRASEIIGDMPVDEIDDRAVMKVVAALYPNGAAPATINRHIHTPIISVLRHASKGKPWKVEITRPAGHRENKPADAPEGIAWYRKVLPHCSANLRALVLFVRLHNRRSAEAFRATAGQLRNGYLEIPRRSTKTKKAERIKLADAVRVAIKEAGKKEADDPLFGYRYSTRRNAYRDLAKACKRAGVPMFSLHKAGRHAFSKHHLDQGGSLADLTQLGRWSGPELPAMLYGHREETALDAKYLPKANSLGAKITGKKGTRSQTGPRAHPKRGTVRTTKGKHRG